MVKIVNKKISLENIINYNEKYSKKPKKNYSSKIKGLNI
jgi:hypothetical protein